MIKIDVCQLKEYIINEDKVPVILESLGCHSIKPYAKEYRAALPNKRNNTAISVKKDTLSSRIYTSDKNVKGDIISIIMEISGLEFKDTLKKIHDILGLRFSINYKAKEPKYDPLEVFKNVQNKRNKEEYSIKKLNESLLDNHRYLKLPHINLIREGIIPRVQKEFEVMFDMKSQRILFPHRYWSSGDLVGIFGRTTVEDWEILGIPKYFGVVPYFKSLNLYGLYQNYKSIQDLGYVVVFEGEKSVLKAKSLMYPVGVALSCHELLDEQVRILIGLDVDIIFALDNDMDEQLSIDMCNQFKGIRNAYYLKDKEGLLGEKDSPIDCGIATFEKLLKNKRKVN